MKIGVTSQNFKTITGHAGKTRRFIIFSQDIHENVERIEKLDLPKEMSMHEFQGTDHPLDSLDVLITGSCGTGFREKMKSRGVDVVTTSATSIESTVKLYLSGKALPEAIPHIH